EVLVVTDQDGTLTQFGSDGSVLNLTQILNLIPAQSAAVDFDPSNGQEVLVVTDDNGGVTQYSPSGTLPITAALGLGPTNPAATAGPGCARTTWGEKCFFAPPPGYTRREWAGAPGSAVPSPTRGTAADVRRLTAHHAAPCLAGPH